MRELTWTSCATALVRGNRTEHGVAGHGYVARMRLGWRRREAGLADDAGEAWCAGKETPGRKGAWLGKVGAAAWC